MARQESVAIAGYFPTSPDMVSRIAAMIAAPTSTSDYKPSFADPCAGDGEAICSLIEALYPGDKNPLNSVDLYTCEMEASRHAALRSRVVRPYSWAHASKAIHGDAFLTSFTRGSKDGISLLYLNPPYDVDPIYGRLEHKFLTRFTDMLADNGLLVFLVPYYALKASAEFLATEYESLRCYRFPAEEFSVYKQVVLFASRSSSQLEVNPEVRDQVLAWAADVSNVPEIPELGSDSFEFLRVPAGRAYLSGLYEWTYRGVDITGLVAKVAPWVQTTRGSGVRQPVPGIIPDLPIQDLLLRTYPMATPPRPAHIAAGIASGLFNGARLEPSDPVASGLPSVLVKGVFNREYKTIEEKHAKDGTVKALVQIQQPTLVTTVLDLKTHKYHVLRSTTEETKGKLTVATMGIADLLKHYGASLMSVMEQQCPILYDPRKDSGCVTLPASPRRLFEAQAHASRAIVKLLGGQKASRLARKGKAAILLGEIGSGKSTVALMSARSIDARRVLVMCPPHLLTSWTNEVAAVFPDAEVRVLTSVADIESLAALPDDGRMVIAVLSRETAKLGHGWGSVSAVCPSCGGVVPEGVDLAKKRARCEHQSYIPNSPLAYSSVDLAQRLQRYVPGDHRILGLLRGRFAHKMSEQYKILSESGEKRPKYQGLPDKVLDQIISQLLAIRGKGGVSNERIDQALTLALFMRQDPLRTALVVQHLLLIETNQWHSFGRELILMLKPGSELQERLIAEFKTTTSYSYGGYWTETLNQIKYLTEGRRGSGAPSVAKMQVVWEGDKVSLEDCAPNSLAAAKALFAGVLSTGFFDKTEVCGEFLFQAIPEPRRVALAGHISKHYPDLFHLLVLDEGHEYATEGSAQERSAHRLTSLGLPVILMTGTIMNGYAESLFMNMWSLSPNFRLEFAREDKQRFIDRYGYRKRIVEDKDKESGEILEYGAYTDRVTRCERVIGNAPGVLPLFLLRHLLPVAVTLHKADLAIDLPKCTQHCHKVDPGKDLMQGYESLLSALLKQIKEDQFQPDLAGRLWGQLAELPSYLDRATDDVGNVENGWYEIRYPESLDSKLVTMQKPLPASTILPKEQWMLDQVERELAEGRNVMVFPWHVALLPRIARLISERIGEPVPILHASKVATGKRQDWIDANVVKKKRRVLVTNPVAIQTGLNNLVHFASEIWMENPACNPVIFRQAGGRVDRIGQKLETRIHYPVYVGTLQEQLYDLLMKKVAVSVSTDGLDPESALQAAGVGEDEYLAGLSIGKQIWAMLNDGVRSGVVNDGPVYHASGIFPKVDPEPPVNWLETLAEMGQG